MAKKKTTVRKSTRQSTYPHRSSTTNSKAASVSPSNASSPSPPPQSDNHHHSHTAASSSSSSASSPTSPAAMTTCGSSSSSRRKGLPRRSPSQNDPSKGIVFSFRFQNDPGLSMAVDIRSYDQQFGPPDPDSCEKADSKAAGPSAGSSLSLAGSHALLHKSADDTIKVGSIHGGAAGGVVRMNGGHWSSDPTAYRNSNVYDQTRNLLILHTRKPSPQAVPSGPSQAESGVSLITTTAVAGAQASTMATTAMTATKGAVEPVTTSSSSPSNSSHPAAFHPYRTQRRSSRQQLTKCGGDSGLPMPQTLDALNSAQSSTRFLNVRGLGGASRGRRMQVILVS
ncbi:hypothetical protein KI688_002188 [Linnemannia hyalina]|uniref:Uncharacterized protein n=1 Tax=Linnemannia hyalina TaxID=64524 RepID=A0A9P8BSC7_9FUNG|nr:hypothetical protein KI688_002188 [Linnemannia hyalina]